jgi:formylglycine-generating enzyme required for sulfatase activity
MPDVFISYSRRNLEFVQQLVDALKKSGKDPWFDQLKEPLSGIAAGVPWWKEIQFGIENVDNFLFVVSPNSISSPYCHAEINYARERGKRLVSVLYCGWIGEGETRKAIDAAIEAIPDDEQIPDSVTSSILNLKKLVRANWLAISEIQYVIFASSVPFEQSLEQLIQALDLDLAWVKMHSQLVQAAKLWEANGFENDYLWGANRLKPVYEIIERRNPELHPLVQEFIRPEQERLLAELEDINTSHRRRSAIGERLALIGDARRGVGLRDDGLPDIVWCPVLGGEVTLQRYTEGQFTGKTFQVQPFYIAKYPITYMQFQAFLDDEKTGSMRDKWWRGIRSQYEKQHQKLMPEQRYKYDNHPRENVSWYQAVAFCRWLTAKLPRDAWPSGQIPMGKNWIIRLPTDWEWQQAATGGQKDFEYPWGKAWDGRRANTSESGIARTTAVGMYPVGASPAPVGALDMSGNVWEWCLNEFIHPETVDIEREADRVMRGGSFDRDANNARALYRRGGLPRLGIADDGFRVVVGPAPKGSGL